ncbi:MAG TPA: glycosyltransferase N-terminal domain-containing protein [Thermoanaerobaculia bacterium]|nr:glycosyltransferase N-terminal domain-containing protein [Thermoanaerobaculia bacterium]
MAWLLYQLAVAILLVTAGPLLLLLRGRHYLPTLRGRLSIAVPEATPGALWLHAVSVGEVAVAAVVADTLPAATPLLVTTITPTGQERARVRFGGRAAVGYLPIDLDPLVERFLRRVQPAALVLVEGDYWPLLLARCRQRELPVVVINGRVGDRTLRLLSKRPRVARWLLGTVDRFAVQTAEDGRRLQSLGVAAEKVTVAGNLKYDAPEPTPQPRLEEAMRAAAAGRPILVAGSTMAGEESAMLAAFQSIGGGERALLVLAPRHPERWEEVARLLAASGLPWQRRSALETASSGASQLSARAAILPGAAEGTVAAAPAVLLLDSLGELASLYRLAAGCFVGGTLAPKGGHNPLEPARFARAIAVGPSMENFRDMAAQFDAAAAWRRVAGSDDLAAAWREWLDEPATASELGARALRLVDTNRGALERTLAVLRPVLARVEAAREAAATAAQARTNRRVSAAATPRDPLAPPRAPAAVEMRAPGRARR